MVSRSRKHDAKLTRADFQIRLLRQGIHEGRQVPMYGISERGPPACRIVLLRQGIEEFRQRIRQILGGVRFAAVTRCGQFLRAHIYLVKNTHKKRV